MDNLRFTSKLKPYPPETFARKAGLLVGCPWARSCYNKARWGKG
jgi:hypothetical protein